MHNVVRLTPRIQPVLNPDTTVYIINAGSTDTRGLGLSESGKNEAERLGSYVQKTGLQFGIVICPNDPPVVQTAQRIFPRRGEMVWPVYTGCEFLCPRNEATTRALRNLVERAKADRDIRFPLRRKDWPTTLYGRCTYQVHDTPDNFLEGFKEEIRRDARALPNISGASRIAIFSREVVGNVIADALFPAFKAKIENIELYPCSILRISAGGCEHFPLLY